MSTNDTPDFKMFENQGPNGFEYDVYLGERLLHSTASKAQAMTFIDGCKKGVEVAAKKSVDRPGDSGTVDPAQNRVAKDDDNKDGDSKPENRTEAKPKRQRFML